MRRRKISLKQLADAAPSRKPGYVEAVMAVASPHSETHVTVSYTDFDDLRERFSLTPLVGPGKELKKLLKLFGIIPEPGCQCNKRAAYMDQMGCQWCRDNIDTILGWLQEEANKRGLLFVKSVARIVVYRAIVNAEAVANKE